MCEARTSVATNTVQATVPIPMKRRSARRRSRSSSNAALARVVRWLPPEVVTGRIVRGSLAFVNAHLKLLARAECAELWYLRWT